jgi:hypothetical protein
MMLCHLDVQDGRMLTDPEDSDGRLLDLYVTRCVIRAGNSVNFRHCTQQPD